MANRLRVARLAWGRYRPLAVVAPDVARHRRLDALIRRHLPGVTASLLGQPSLSADGGFIDWYSDLAGQPLALGALAKEARAEARALLADRLNSLTALAERLDPVDPAGAEQLRAAVSFPSEETVYVVGGQPVITFWGHRPLTAAEPPPLEPPVAASAPAPDPASGRWHGRGLWLGLALLVLAAAGAALLGSGALRWPPWGPDFAGLMAAAKEEENALSRRVAALETNLNEELARGAAGQALIAARGEEERLRTVLAGARTRLTDALALCPLKQQLQGAADEGQDLNRRIDQLAGNMNAVLAQCRREQEEAKRKAAEEQEKAMAASRQAEAQQRGAKERRQAVDGDAAKAPPKAKPGGTELPPCPGERPPEDAPDVAIVLDASGSMGLSASASTAEIQKQLRSLGGLLGLGAMML
ncbi:MAG: hypothetical protein ACXWVJ_07835, partial [Caulobacteraceae bacterium]